MYLWHSRFFLCVSVCCRGNWFRVIRDDAVRVHVWVSVLVFVLVFRIYSLVSPPSEVGKGPLLELLMGCPPSDMAWVPSAVTTLHLDVVTLVEWRSS